jgi:hypothetical protein
MARLTPLVLVVLGVGSAFAQLARAEAKVEEQVVGPMVDGATYVVSPRGGHLATVAPKGSRVVVTVDGVAGPKFDAIVQPAAPYVDPRPLQAASARPGFSGEVARPVTFSPDGSRYAYVGRQGEDWVLIADGKEMAKLPGSNAPVGAGGIASDTSTDLRIQFAGEHLLLASSTPQGRFLWVDGQKWPGSYQSAGQGASCTDPLITPDGAHIAYVGQIARDKSTVILDGKDAGYLAEQLQWTADGKHLIGVARTPGGDQLLVDGRQLFKARGIIAVYLPPAGNRIIAVLQHRDPKTGSTGQFLLADGKPVEASLSQTIKRVIFSPDGKHYAALCGQTSREFVVIDGKKGQEYMSIIDNPTFAGQPTFSPDSSKFVYDAMNGVKSFVVVNDDESDAFNNQAFFVLSPSGKHLVMLGVRGQSSVCAVDAKVIRRPQQTGFNVATLRFSPDESRWAWAVGGPNDGAVLLDSAETGLAGPFSFSPDGKHLAVCGGRPAAGAHGVFLDGKQVFASEQPVLYHAFTPDSQHLYWMTREPDASKDAPPGSYQFVTYLDAKPVARSDHRNESERMLLLPNGFAPSAQTPPAWHVDADGSLVCLAASDDGIKRLKITPTPETNLATMLAAAEGKGTSASDKGKR